MKKNIVRITVLAAGLGVAGLFGSATAFADASADGTDAISTNPTTQDAQGFGVVNHMSGPWNDGFNGIGHIRSGQTGGGQQCCWHEPGSGRRSEHRRLADAQQPRQQV